MMTTKTFDGFSPKTLEFLRRLERNNDKNWFAAHRDDYLRDVAEPMWGIAASLVPMIQELDPRVVSEPRRLVARIHRDTRFSKDKTPYWTHPWIGFRRNLKNWFQGPTYFFEIHKSGYSFGMNIFAPASITMRRFREKIDDAPEEFQELIAFLRRSRTFRLDTEKYKRRWPCAHSPEIDPWYQSRNIEVVCTRKPDALLYSRKLVSTLIDRFVQLKPLYDYLWSITVIPDP